MPAPVLAVCPLKTVVAEKLEAIVKLARFNSRVKDYFDLWVLMRHENFDRDLLQTAIRATFARWKTAMPMILPVGLAPTFATEKQVMWQAFLTCSGLHSKLLCICWVRTALISILRDAGSIPDAHSKSSAIRTRWGYYWGYCNKYSRI